MGDERLRAIGWKPFFDQQLDHEANETPKIVRVSAHHGSQIVVLGDDGEFNIPTQLAESAGAIAVGDWLVIDREDHRLIKRLERTTLLCRKACGEEIKTQLIAANIDTIFIVCSCNEDFSLSRIERYLAMTLQAGAMPVVILTKADVCHNAAELRRQVEKLHVGLLVETIDAREPAQVAVLGDWCRPGQTIALLGSSGVGKSTLANSLGAGELATGAIREKDGKGRHTTTARSLHLLDGGGVLVDNPGMRELQLPGCEAGVADLFDDVIAITQRCRFNDCNHDGDSGCAVPAALASGDLDPRRFANYMKLNAEQAHHARSLVERRERDRRTGKMYKSILAEKKRRRDANGRL